MDQMGHFMLLNIHKIVQELEIGNKGIKMPALFQLVSMDRLHISIRLYEYLLLFRQLSVISERVY